SGHVEGANVHEGIHAHDHRPVDPAQALCVVGDTGRPQVAGAVTVDVDAAADRAHERHVVGRRLPKPVAQRYTRVPTGLVEHADAFLVGDRAVVVQVDAP